MIFEQPTYFKVIITQHVSWLFAVFCSALRHYIFEFKVALLKELLEQQKFVSLAEKNVFMPLDVSIYLVRMFIIKRTGIA